jgi:hypothetical protein
MSACTRLRCRAASCCRMNPRRRDQQQAELPHSSSSSSPSCWVQTTQSSSCSCGAARSMAPRVTALQIDHMKCWCMDSISASLHICGQLHDCVICIMLQIPQPLRTLSGGKEGIQGTQTRRREAMRHFLTARVLARRRRPEMACWTATRHWQGMRLRTKTRRCAGWSRLATETDEAGKLHCRR